MYSKIKISMILLTILLMAQTVEACPNELVKAEKLLRLHSEVMVEALTCRYGSRGEDLTKSYVSFTKRHESLFEEAERHVKLYYKQERGSNGLEELDKLRTQLANDAGALVAKVSAPVYCEKRRDWGLSLWALSQSQIRIASDEMPSRFQTSLCERRKRAQR